MIMSVSILTLFKGAAAPSSCVNLSIVCRPPSSMAHPYRAGAVGQGAGWLGGTALPAQRLLVHARLDPLHVGIGEAEMVANLVHQHMAHDRTQRLIVLGPVVQDRPAVEPDHVRHRIWVADAEKRQTDPAEQAKQIEL